MISGLSLGVEQLCPGKHESDTHARSPQLITLRKRVACISHPSGTVFPSFQLSGVVFHSFHLSFIFQTEKVLRNCILSLRLKTESYSKMYKGLEL